MESKPSAFKDYYYILGVSQDATSKEIQEAYNDLYQKYGPHINISGQDPEILMKTFRDITEAYEVLTDPAKRADYDQNNSQHFQKGDLHALWGKFMEVKPESRAAAEDTELEIEVTLLEALKGIKKVVRLDEAKPCDGCSQLKPVQRLHCSNCKGVGYTQSRRTEEIELPPGLYDGLQIKKAGLGKFDLQSGRQGNLLLIIKLKPHPVLKVQGKDITCNVPVTICEAVLGAEIDVPTATGKVIMRIQPRTQAGRVYRLKGLGLAGADQFVTIEIAIPQQLSEEELSLFQKLKKLSGNSNPRESLYSRLPLI